MNYSNARLAVGIIIKICNQLEYAKKKLENTLNSK